MIITSMPATMPPAATPTNRDADTSDFPSCASALVGGAVVGCVMLVGQMSVWPGVLQSGLMSAAETKGEIMIIIG